MIEQRSGANIFRLYLLDTETSNSCLGTEIEKSFGSKEVRIPGIDKTFDFSDINNFDELRDKYSNFKVLAYSINIKGTTVPTYSC